jgi:hypothetical protein
MAMPIFANFYDVSFVKPYDVNSAPNSLAHRLLWDTLGPEFDGNAEIFANFYDVSLVKPYDVNSAPTSELRSRHSPDGAQAEPLRMMS